LKWSNLECGIAGLHHSEHEGYQEVLGVVKMHLKIIRADSHSHSYALQELDLVEEELPEAIFLFYRGFFTVTP